MQTATLRARAVGTVERAYSLLTIKEAEDGNDERIIRGTATTPEPDRMGDIVEPLGVSFKNPLPLLRAHDTKMPVGTVKLNKPTKDGITFEARMPKIAEGGSLKDRIDMAWGEVKAGLVRAVSIGFRPLEHAFMDNGGVRFLESEILELSLVSVPANADATIATIKSIDGRQLAALGEQRCTVVSLNRPGVTGKPKAKEATFSVTKRQTIAEQISAFQATRMTKSARMDSIMDDAGEKGETLNAEQKEEYDTLGSELKEIDEHLVRLRVREKTALVTATEVKGANDDEASQSRDRRQAIQVRSQQLPKGWGFVRLLAARYMAKEDGCSPADIAISRSWGDELASILRIPKSYIERAAVAPATVTDPAWAGALAQLQNLTGEFIELLYARELISRIPGLRKVPFNVKVPRQTGGTTAYWVAEAAPKPVSKAAFDTVTLTFAKVAGITYMTQELMRFSQPNAESLLVNDLTKSINKLVDRDFLDPAKAVAAGVSPASITNGAPFVPASGTTADAFRADFGNALSAFAAANLDLSDLVIVMRETQALKLGLLRNDLGGVKEFADVTKGGGFIEGVPVVTSENVATGVIAFISASNVLLADDGGVSVDISTEASIQASDAPDNPALATTVLVNFWQNNLVGIRCERFVTWQKAHASAVVYINNANYG